MLGYFSLVTYILINFSPHKGSLVTTDSEESQDAEGEKEKSTVSEEMKLPETLEDGLKELVVSLKKRASESSTEGKCKFFSTDVNDLLLR